MREDLPADSRLYSELAFQQKEKRRRARERMSFTRKIEILDRLLEMSKGLPRLDDTAGRS
jgi:hypothetical protein